MFDEDDHWGERQRDFSAKPTRTTAKWTVRAWLIVLLIVMLASATVAVLWALRVGTSDVKGRGDSEIIKNDAKNRIRAQEGFWDKYQAIVVADQKITAHGELLKARPGDLKLETELIGLRQICLSAVGTYNATARKFTQQDFMDAELPAQVDDTSPANLDCKENK